AGVEPDGLEDFRDDLDVVLGLLQVFLPLSLQVIVRRATNRGSIDLDSPHLRLQHLVEKLVQLIGFHGRPPDGHRCKARAAQWSRFARCGEPVLLCPPRRPIRLTVRTRPSQGRNTGSIPVWATFGRGGRCATGSRESSNRSWPRR